MNAAQAACLVSLIEAAIDGNWPATKFRMLEAGFSPEDVEQAARALCEAAGMPGYSILKVSDFDGT